MRRNRLLHRPWLYRDRWGRLVHVYEDGTVIPAVMGAGPPPVYDQDSFRGRNDDGTEITATWKALVNIDWTQTVDENFRVRFLVQETAGRVGADFKEDLQYNLNGAGWNDVDDAASLVVRMSLSGNFAHGDDTVQRLGGGVFIAANSGMNETNPPGAANEPDFAGDDETEFEFCVQIRSDDVDDGDTVELRVTNNGVTFAAYTNTPSITVDKPAAELFEAARQFGSVQPMISPVEVVAY